MTVLTETSAAQALHASVGKLKLNGSVNGHAQSNGRANGLAHANGSNGIEAKEKDSKLVDPFNYVVSRLPGPVM